MQNSYGYCAFDILTLMAAAVGKEEPYNFNQTSCKFVQNRTKFSGTGLYISKMSSPAENTVFDDCYPIGDDSDDNNGRAFVREERNPLEC